MFYFFFEECKNMTIDEDSIVSLADVLREFASHYRKKYGTDISPSAMMRNKLSVNRLNKPDAVKIQFQTHSELTDKTRTDAFG